MYIVNIKDIKRIAPFSSNVDDVIIEKMCLQTQNTEIVDLLSEDLFDELYLQVTSNTLTSLNQILHDKLKPVLSWKVYVNTLPLIFLKIREQGVVNLTSDNATNASITEFKFMSEQANKFAQQNTIRFINWLNKNKNNYPLFLKSVHCSITNSNKNGQDTRINNLFFTLPTKNKGI
jgi:hypothetical protein